MIIKREIGEKGQVVIPKDIREMLGLSKGERVVFEVKNDNEVIIKKEPTSKAFLEDFLNVPKIKRDKRTIKEMILDRYEKNLS